MGTVDGSIPRSRSERWPSRTVIVLAVAAMAVLAGSFLALGPFSASSSARSSTFDCGTSVSFLRTKDIGPDIRRFLATARPRADGAAPSQANLSKLAGAQLTADRYHACHRPATVRLGFAGLLLLAGALTLTASRRPPSITPSARSDDQEDRFLSGFGYQPALDGLRAIAIAWVLLTHTGLTGIFKTGDHGVDLFFVLSGFLITTLLLREHVSSGRISLGNFYVRRALRLFPVILLALLLGSAARLLDPHWFWSPKWSGLAAIALYVSNWMHVHDLNALGFLTPTWSLAIEEQFYLLWPPVVAGLLALGKGRRQVGQAAACGAVFAALYRLSTTVDASGTSAAYSWYYNSFQRADALLIGGLLAAVLSPRVVASLRSRAPMVSGLAWAGVVGVVYVCIRQTVIDDQAFLPAWGLIVLEVSFALMVCALVTLQHSRGAALLAAPWLVWIGRRSYGLYVLHVPVFVMVQRLNIVHGRAAVMAVEIPLSLVAAALSYRYIEAPALRLKGRFGARPMATRT